jgi:hypothetical protein
MSEETIISELRSLQGFGLITFEHCVRCERYVERYPDVLEYDGSTTQILERIVETV